MAGQLLLVIATPEREVLREEAEEVQVPTIDGYIGVLPQHAPLLAKVGIGVLRYRKGGTTYVAAVNGGYVEVLEDQVRVLAETAERPEEISVERAEAARERAERRLTSGSADVDYERARAALARAMARLRAVREAQGPEER